MDKNLPKLGYLHDMGPNLKYLGYWVRQWRDLDFEGFSRAKLREVFIGKFLLLFVDGFIRLQVIMCTKRGLWVSTMSTSPATSTQSERTNSSRSMTSHRKES